MRFSNQRIGILPRASSRRRLLPTAAEVKGRKFYYSCHGICHAVRTDVRPRRTYPIRRERKNSAAGARERQGQNGMVIVGVAPDDEKKQLSVGHWPSRRMERHRGLMYIRQPAELLRANRNKRKCYVGATMPALSNLNGDAS